MFGRGANIGYTKCHQSLIWWSMLVVTDFDGLSKFCLKANSNVILNIYIIIFKFWRFVTMVFCENYKLFGHYPSS
jgi:hypothetical protein